jgi:uncharacterized protein involved in exopolysaccharide biosynthesis
LGVLKRRKKVILGVFLAAIIAATAGIILAPKVYLAQALIQNGRPINIGAAEKRNAKEIIDSYDFMDTAIKKSKLDLDAERFRDYITTEESREGKRLLIQVKYSDRDIAFQACQAIADLYVEEGNVLYQESVALTSDFLKEVSGQVQFYRTNIERLRNEVASASSVASRPGKAGAASSLLGLYNSLIEYTNNLNSLITKRNDLMAVLSQRREFKIIVPPVRPKFATEPNVKLYFMVAAVVGILGGILLAFFLEYLKNSRRRQNNP